MDTRSVWRATAAPRTAFPALQGDLTADILIIGGGITGITLAALLAQQGRGVVLLEAYEVGGGATGNSTGNLYETVSRGMSPIVSHWGADVAQQVTAHRRAAIDTIEQFARGAAEADFRRCDLMLYAETPQHQEQIEEEFEALSKAGCAVEHRVGVPAGLPEAQGQAVVLPDQAQIQPQGYVAHLARLAAEAGARIHEQSPVTQIDFRARRVVTPLGSVLAQEIVMATHTPKSIRLPHAEMPVHREYGIALPLGEPNPGAGIFWRQGNESLSIRTIEGDGGGFLVCVGQEHTTGTHNARAALIALETLAQRHFGQAQVTYRWSAQNYRSADGLPYIGRDGSGCFLATGFCTDGLAWGTVAARVIAEQLAGQTPDMGELCKPTRLSLIKGARTILEEVGVMTKALVKDYLTHRQEEKLSVLAPGDSAIVESEGEAVAAWRAPDGELFAVSPVCTHMGCKVHWNSFETSWDCPCHGSRFRPDGTVIEGPALAPLKRKHIGALEGPSGAS